MNKNKKLCAQALIKNIKNNKPNNKGNSKIKIRELLVLIYKIPINNADNNPRAERKK